MMMREGERERASLSNRQMPSLIIIAREGEKKTERENSHETHHKIKHTQIAHWNTSGYPSTLHSYSFNVRTQTHIWQFEASSSPQQITRAWTHTHSQGKGTFRPSELHLTYIISRASLA